MNTLTPNTTYAAEGRTVTCPPFFLIPLLAGATNQYDQAGQKPGRDMSRKKWGLACAVVLGSTPFTGAAAPVDWPDLPKDCFVSGRPSTSADLRKGCATFMLDHTKAGRTEVSSGTPLGIDIPQYAWLVDEASGKKTPVILIQAEEDSAVKTVGYKELDSHSLGVAILSDMILLGRKKPAE